MNTNDEHASRLNRSVDALLAFYGRKLQTRLDLLKAPPKVVAAEHVVFGRDLQSHGFWGLRADRGLTADERGDAAATFKTILSSIGRLDTGPTPEVRFEAALMAAHGAMPTNVISMVEARRKKQFPAGFLVGPAAPRTLKRDCLIEASDAREIHKLAFEIHSRGTRTIFLPFADLDDATRVCFTSLLNLGQVTLFVPDLLALADDEQTALATLMDFYWDIRPLIAVGTRRPIAELRAHPGVNPVLLKALQRAHIQLFGTMNRLQDLEPWLVELEREDA